MTVEAKLRAAVDFRTDGLSRSEVASGVGAVGNPCPKVREERVLAACECVIDLAAALFAIPGRDLRRAGRCGNEISRVRQIAMYVAHVVLRLNMTELGKGFGRDRTTVMHACHLIEHMRDDEEFDRIVARTERIVEAAFRGREPF